MANVIHFNTIVGAFGDEFRDGLSLQGTSDENKRDLPLRRAQEFERLCFPARGDGVLGDNQVKGMRAQPFAELFGSSDDFRADREMHLVEFAQAALNLPRVTMKKEDV
jgi:hypothetical protein